MRSYKAMLFDLDDTLLDRDRAVDNLFLMILEKWYEDVKQSAKKAMLKKFREYDNRSYGLSDKTEVLESFFDEFPPKYRLPRKCLQDFWNHHFPHCFSKNQTTVNIVNTIKRHVKVAIITNGSTRETKSETN